jgi:hypothetical protein
MCPPSYCLTPTGGVTPSTDPIALVAVEWDHSSGYELLAFVGQAGKCSAGQYEVRTYNTKNERSEFVAFYIVVPS